MNQIPHTKSDPFDILPGNAVTLKFVVPPRHTVPNARFLQPVQIAHVDGFGNIIPTATDDISVTLGGGGSPPAILSGTTTRTPVNGIATFDDLSISREGTSFNLNAWVNGVLKKSSDNFTVKPYRLAFLTSPVAPMAGEVISPAVQVEIQQAGGVRATALSSAIRLDVNFVSGVVKGTTTVNAVDGVATFDNVWLESTSHTRLTTSAVNLDAAGGYSEMFSVAAGAPATIRFIELPTPVAVNAPIAPAVKVEVRDAFNNRCEWAVGNIEITATHNVAIFTLTGTLTQPIINGIATFDDLAIDTPAQGYRFQISFPGVPTITSSAFTVRGPFFTAVAGLGASGTYTATAGTAVPAIVIHAYDSHGIFDPTASGDATLSVKFNLDGSDYAVAGTVTLPLINGVATFDDIVFFLIGNFRIHINSDPDFAPLVSPMVTITGGVAADWEIYQQPQPSVTLSQNIVVRVRLIDAYGNPTTHPPGPQLATTIDFHTNPTGASIITGATQVSVGSDGTAQFAFKIDTIGVDYVMILTMPGFSDLLSTPVTVTGNPPRRLVFVTQPIVTTAGTTMGAVTLEFRDAGENQAIGYTGDVTLTLDVNPTDAVLLGTLVKSAVDGVVTFDDLRIDTAGTGYKLRAISHQSMSGESKPRSDEFEVLSGIPAQLQFVEVPTQGGVDADLPAVKVAVVDAHGNVVLSAAGSVTLSLAANPAAATLSGTLAQPLVDGVATFDDCRLDAPGVGFTLVATDSNLSTTSEPFAIVPHGAADFSVTPARPQIGETATLQWGIAGNPTGVTLDPNGEDVTGTTSAVRTPFPIPRGLDPCVPYRLSLDFSGARPATTICAIQAGDDGNDAITAIAIGPDGATLGVAGTFTGALNWPTGGANFTSHGVGTDGFVMRLSRTGSVIWAAHLASNDPLEVTAATVLGDGSVVVAGAFSTHMYVAAGTLDETPLTGSGVFLARFDAKGQLAFAVRADGDRAAALAANLDNSQIAVVGQFSTATATFGEGELSETTLATSGGTDAFVAVFAINGSLRWAAKIGGTDDVAATGVAFGPLPMLAECGHFTAAATAYHADGTVAESLVGAGNRDWFAIGFDALGAVRWATKAGGTGDDTATAIGGTSDGEWLITGHFSGSATFGPGEANETTLLAAGVADAALARIGADGALAWVRQLEAGATAIPANVAVWPDDSVVIGGQFDAGLTFAAGSPEAVTLTSAGAFDGFWAVYSATGEFVAAHHAAASANANAGVSAVAVFRDGTAVIGGAFGDAMTVMPGELGATTMTAPTPADTDAWLAVVVPQYARFAPIRPGGPAWGTMVERSGSNAANLVAYAAGLAGGRVVVSGNFRGLLALGSGQPNAVTFPDNGLGTTDGFLAIYEPNGTLIGARRYGTPGSNDSLSQITPLPDGTFLARSFGASIVWAAGEANETTITGNSLARLDPDGTLIWAREGVSGTLCGIAGGKSFHVSTFVNTLVVGAGQPNETTLVAPPNLRYGYIARFDLETGLLDWAAAIPTQAGNLEFLVATGCVLPDGSFAFGGLFKKDVIFGENQPNETLLVPAHSSGGAFVAKYTSDGTLVWAKAVGGGESATLSVVPHASGDVIALTKAPNDYVFPTTPFPTVNMPPTPVLLRLAGTTGAYRWARPIGYRTGTGSINQDTARAVALPHGQLAIIAEYGSGVIFGMGTSRAFAPPFFGSTSSNADVAILVFDDAGTLQWGTTANCSTRLTPNSIAAMPDGSVLASLHLSANVTVGPGEPNELIGMWVPNLFNNFIVRIHPYRD